MIELFSIVGGLFGGAATTLIWEGGIKPRRDKKWLVCALAREVQLISKEIERRVLLYRRSELIEMRRLPLASPVFNAVAARVGELDEATNDVVLFYFRLSDLNAMINDWSNQWDAHEAEMRQKALPRSSREGGLKTTRTAFMNVAREAIEIQERLLPELRNIASLPQLSAPVSSREMMERPVDPLPEERR